MPGPGRSFSRRRAALTALLVVVVSLLASGCGQPDPTALLDSGDTPAADTTTDGSTVAVKKDPPAGMNEISGTTAAPGAEVAISAITPKRFVTAHCSKPIMVVMYQPGALVDEGLLTEARAAAAQVKGTTLLVYTPKQHKAFGDLASKLGLLAAPGVATVDRSGRIENFWTGFVDRALILESLQQAAVAKPCKVSSADVPAVGGGAATSDLANASALVSGEASASAAIDPTTGEVQADSAAALAQAAGGTAEFAAGADAATEQSGLPAAASS